MQRVSELVASLPRETIETTTYGKTFGKNISFTALVKFKHTCVSTEFHTVLQQGQGILMFSERSRNYLEAGPLDLNQFQNGG